jgi:hypothetical protein
MTLTLPGADYRGCYQRLGIPLPDIRRTNVSVRCFADPAAHHHEDRNPSCSVNTLNGAWNCRACGARGGAFDAAIKKGHDPRSAIELMIVHGITERRAQLRTASELLRDPDAFVRAKVCAHPRLAEDRQPRMALQSDEQDISRWQTALPRRPSLISKLARERGWGYDTIRALELGLDRGRITIPIRNADGQLRGVLRYQPEHNGRPKMLAVLGSRIGLVPHPAAELSERILLVEGPPDVIAARSRGLRRSLYPGTTPGSPPGHRYSPGGTYRSSWSRHARTSSRKTDRP